jgi:ankyrin repeat protein
VVVSILIDILRMGCANAATEEEVLGDVLPGPADTQLSSAEAEQQIPDVEEGHDANTAGDTPSNSDVKKEVRFGITGGSNDAAGNDTGQAYSSVSIEKKEIGAEVGSDPSEDHGGEVSTNDEKEDDKEQSKLEELCPNDSEADDEPEFLPAEVPKWKKGHARMTVWDEAQWLKYFADKRPESEKEIDYMPNEPDKGPDSFSANGVTELHRAAHNGWSEVILAGMLDIKFGIEGQDQWGKTPLYYAAKNGKDGTVRFLLGRGANIESETGNHWTAMHAAARAGHDNVIEVLLKHVPAANINVKTGAKLTPLFLAVVNKRKSTVELLLSHGAEQGARNENKDTMLHIAASKELPEILTLLLEYTTGAESLNDKGKQPLTQPLDTTDEMIIKLRREKIMDTNDDEEIIFDAAFDTWRNGEMLALLLRCYWPRLELPEYDPIMGFTLLHDWLFKAVSNGTNDCLDAMLKSKIGPRLDLDWYVGGKTMLHVATQNGNYDMVQRLSQARAEINAATE